MEQSLETAAKITFSKNLFKAIFNRSSYRKQKQSLESGLATKAWVIHILIQTSSRVIYPLLGVAYWQEAYAAKKIPSYADKEFVLSSKDFVQTSMIVLTVLSVLLDLAAWRFKSLRKLIYYFELVYSFVYALLPLDIGNMHVVFIMIYSMYLFTVFSSTLGVDIIAATIAQFIVDFLIKPYLYVED